MSTSYNLDDLHSDIGHLYHLIDTITDTMLQEVSFETADGKRDHGADRVNALAWVARDVVDTINTQIEANYTTLRYGGASEKKEAKPARPNAATSEAVLTGMSIYDLYCAINAMVLVRQVMNLECCAASGGKNPALHEWSEDRQNELDAQLELLFAELDRRPDADDDDRSTRKMALHRASGLLGGRPL